MLAPTVIIQGARFSAVASFGPLLPTEQTTIIPFLAAWKEPIEIPSLKTLEVEPPSDTDKTSTPSWIATSNAASMSASKHSSITLLIGGQQTLYDATLAFGEPPFAVPLP